MKNLRILSLLPAATEIVYLLGLEKNLVGVSNECDFPSSVKKLPQVTSSLINNEMTSLEIDEKIKNLGHSGLGISHIDQDQLKKLKPNLILTQELCEVCAIPFTEVKKAAKILNSDIKIISLEPESISDILENILVIGKNTGKQKEAQKIVKTLKNRLIKIKANLPKTPNLPKVLVIEWLEPLMVAGHWVPEMVKVAGGKMLITKLGEKSKYISEQDLKKLNPEICIIAPCGFDIKRTLKENSLIKNLKLKIKNSKFYLVDGNSYLTRPGPRIIDGVEILSEIMYPEIFKRNHPPKDWHTY